MDNAPPVAYPVGRFIWGWLVYVGVLLASAAGLAAWQLQSQASSTMVWGAWVFWLMCALATAYAGPQQVLSEGHLFWSGEAWLWRPGPIADVFKDEDQRWNLTVGLDFGAAMLLLLRAGHAGSQGRGPWFCAWVNEQAMPSKWHGFRCAVYSRPKATMQPQVPPK
jgi:hypothetical protein